MLVLTKEFPLFAAAYAVEFGGGYGLPIIVPSKVSRIYEPRFPLPILVDFRRRPVWPMSVLLRLTVLTGLAREAGAAVVVVVVEDVAELRRETDAEVDLELEASEGGEEEDEVLLWDARALWVVEGVKEVADGALGRRAWPALDEGGDG